MFPFFLRARALGRGALVTPIDRALRGALIIRLLCVLTSQAGVRRVRRRAAVAVDTLRGGVDEEAIAAKKQ